jgi:hypothetical protein
VEVNTVPLSVFNMTATQKKRLKKRTRGGYEAKIEEIKGKFTSLNNRSGNFVERSLSP